MTVGEVCKGPLKRGTQQNKILHLNNGQRPIDPQYIHAESIGNVDVEVGKEYVVFLRPQQSPDGTFHEYAIDGFQFGLREVKGAGPDTAVLNNETKTWESLGTIVKLD